MQGHYCAIEVGCGRILVSIEQFNPPRNPLLFYVTPVSKIRDTLKLMSGLRPPWERPAFSCEPFSITDPRDGSTWTGRDISFPIWFVVLSCIIYPAITLMRRLACHPLTSQSHEQPLCSSCGYSLHGLQSQRCPECGKPLPASCSQTQPSGDEAGNREADRRE